MIAKTSMATAQNSKQQNRITLSFQPLPMTGRYLLEDAAVMLGYEYETLRKKLHAEKIRTISLGAKMIVDFEWLWEDLIRLQAEGVQQ